MITLSIEKTIERMRQEGLCCWKILTADGLYSSYPVNYKKGDVVDMEKSIEALSILGDVMSNCEVEMHSRKSFHSNPVRKWKVKFPVKYFDKESKPALKESLLRLRKAIDEVIEALG